MGCRMDRYDNGHCRLVRGASTALWLPRLAATGLATIWLATTAQAQQIVQPYAAQKATTSAAAVEHSQRLSTLADRQATSELVAELQRLSQGAGNVSIANEWLLDRGLHELSRVQPTTAAKTLLHTISQRPAQLFVQVDPDHGSHAVPLYDPGATARFVLRNWERTAAREQASAALAADLSSPLERFAADNISSETAPAKAGIVDAFRAATPQTLARQKSAIAAALTRGERVDEIAAVTAERLSDAGLYELVIGHADDAVALGAVQRVRAVLGDAAALDILIAASARQQIASAALLEIGRVAEQDSRARAYLFTMLTDPAAGSSAAAGLASLHDPTVAAELGRRLVTTKRESERRQLALALKLDGSSAARAQLDQFVKARSGSAKLRKEVRTWLAQ